MATELLAWWQAAFACWPTLRDCAWSCRCAKVHPGQRHRRRRADVTGERLQAPLCVAQRRHDRTPAESSIGPAAACPTCSSTPCARASMRRPPNASRCWTRRSRRRWYTPP